MLSLPCIFTWLRITDICINDSIPPVLPQKVPVMIALSNNAKERMSGSEHQ
jgi:hypothetical protein